MNSGLMDILRDLEQKKNNYNLVIIPRSHDLLHGIISGLLGTGWICLVTSQDKKPEELVNDMNIMSFKRLGGCLIAKM